MDTPQMAGGMTWSEPLLRPPAWQVFLKRTGRLARTNVLGTIGLALVVILLCMAAFAPLITGGVSPRAQAYESFIAPGSDHWFGTDRYGRDIFSRTIYGSRVSLQVGLFSVFFGGLAGITLGLIAGYAGRWVDVLIVWLLNMMLAFPTLVLALAIISVLEPSVTNLVIAISIAIVPGLALVVRGSVLSVKQMDYILACRAVGAPHLRIMLRHVLPNVAAPIIVVLTAAIAGAILGEAALSYLGLGVPPPTPSWGQDLSGSARDFFVYAPWIAIFPGIAISVAVFGFNLFGDALRDVLDPRLRSR